MRVAESPAMDLSDAPERDDHCIGPADAPIVVVEYGDFECPSCKQAAPAVEMLLNRFRGRVRFVYRHFPLQEVHPHAAQAAEAAECAGVQQRFWDMHRLLFEHQSALTRADLVGYARRLELDVERFESEIDAGAWRGRVGRDIESGRRSGVRSTPGFFVNGTRTDVSFGLHALFDAADAVLKTSQ